MEEILNAEEMPELEVTEMEPLIPEETPITPEEPAAPQEEETIAEQEEDPEVLNLRRQKNRRKRIFRGALRFYTLLFGGILCVLVLLLCLTSPLKTLLTHYETAQPKYVAAEIFDIFFSEPDWAVLYDMAGIEPTEFEGRNEYVAYMKDKVGSKKLDYVEIPAAPSGEKRYSVRLEGEEVATFTMLPVDDGVSTFGRWTFGEVEVFFTRQESVTIRLMPGYTVYINGVPLDDSYTTLQVNTLAEDYLPEGLHGYRYLEQTISGLLVQPSVIVLDQFNNPVELTQDPETGVYATPIDNTVEMTWGEKELILETIQAQAQFAIRDIPMTKLREYFTPGSQAYKAITSADPLVEKWRSYKFDDSATVIKDFYRYSDTLFSVWAEVKVDVTVKKGQVESFTFAGTYFFSTNSVGSAIATQMYDVNVQERVEIPVNPVQ